MKWFFRINVTVFIILIGLQFLLKPHQDKRAREYTQDMMYSFAFQTQSANPFLQNNQTQQPYIPGIVPYHSEMEDNSVDVKNKKSLNRKRGQELFKIYCQVCHGVSGEGDGPVTKKGFPPPPSLKDKNVMKYSDEELFRIISDGIKNMPAYKSQILPGDRYKIIEYVRQLQEK